MFSLTRKISSSQHASGTIAEQSKSDDDNDKHESEPQEQQQEEVDGTSYDPDADPRDPGRYYTFPHFAEDERESDPTQQGLETPEREPGPSYHDLQAPPRDPGTSAHDNEQASTNSSTTQSTPIPKSTSPSSAEPASPPFWPVSPLSKRLRPKTSPSPASPVLQRRATTSQPSSPQISRVQTPRRASAQVQTQHKSTSSRHHSSPAARSLRSISAAQSPRNEMKKLGSQGLRQAKETKDGQSPVRKQQQPKRLSSHSQGSPKSDRGQTG